MNKAVRRKTHTGTSSRLLFLLLVVVGLSACADQAADAPAGAERVITFAPYPDLQAAVTEAGSVIEAELRLAQSGAVVGNASWELGSGRMARRVEGEADVTERDEPVAGLDNAAYLAALLAMDLRGEAGELRTAANWPVKGVVDSSKRERKNGQYRGWVCDPDRWSQTIKVRARSFRNGVRYANANLLREAAVGSACGGTRYHGFNFTVGPLSGGVEALDIDVQGDQVRGVRWVGL